MNRLVFENLSIPIINYKFSVPLDFLLLTTFLLIIGYGSFLFKNKSINLLFLDKKYSFFTLLFPINFALNSIFLRVYLFNARIYLSFELIELFIYIIFLSDVLLKIQKFDKT